MQDEVEANAKTLELEKTTILEEDFIHFTVYDLFWLPEYRATLKPNDG